MLLVFLRSHLHFLFPIYVFDYTAQHEDLSGEGEECDTPSPLLLSIPFPPQGPKRLDTTSHLVDFQKALWILSITATEIFAMLLLFSFGRLVLNVFGLYPHFCLTP